MTPREDFILRQATLGDRDAAYDVCLKTGDNGEDATPLYQDPRLLGHLYVGPYLELEPELAFVLEDQDGVCGYVLGALDTAQFNEGLLRRWLPPLQEQTLDPQGDPSTWNHDQRILHELHHPDSSFPPTLEPYPSHLHIDLLPRARAQGWGRRMIETLFDALRAKASPGVHLGVGLTNERAQGFYRKLGFKELFSSGNEVSGALFMGLRL